MRYTAGKADWTAHGWPTEGEATRRPRAGTLVRTDLLTCAPDERLVDVQQRRPRAAEPDVAVVVNGDRVVLGVLSLSTLERAPIDRRIAEVMERAPRTIRPSLAIDAAEAALGGDDHVLVTTSDGALIGVLRRADVARAARAA
jgi:CBS domain-containing protein